ncbi:MAG: pseudouridine synthase [Treponema sp.]
MNDRRFFSEPVSLLFVQNKFCSKRSAKTFFKNNLICVNQKKVSDPKTFVNIADDVISVNGKTVSFLPHIYVMMNKPRGAVCSTVSDSHKTVFDLFKGHFTDGEIKRLKCAGRLDCESTGLLIFSTNGSFVNKITAPENKIKKTYYVKLQKKVVPDLQSEFSRKAMTGIFIPPEKKSDGFFLKDAQIEWLTQESCSVTISEGKFHEVRRLFSALGNSVIELKRVQTGGLKLDENLCPGQFKILSESEILL